MVSLSCSWFPSLFSPAHRFEEVITTPRLIIPDFTVAKVAVPCAAPPLNLLDQSNWFPAEESQSALTHRFSADCGEMHHTLIITANVRRGARRGRAAKTRGRPGARARSCAHEFPSLFIQHLSSFSTVKSGQRFAFGRESSGGGSCSPH